MVVPNSKWNVVARAFGLTCAFIVAPLTVIAVASLVLTVGGANSYAPASQPAARGRTTSR